MKMLSVVIPVYNSAAFIAKTLDSVGRYLGGNGYAYEIIVVDDGSGDKSAVEVERWMGPRKDVKLIRIGKNSGKGCAVKRGVLESGGDYILVTDADLTFTVDNIKAAYEMMERGADAVIGNRRLADSIYLISPKYFFGIFLRHTISYVFNLIVRLLLGSRAGDVHCGFKCFRAEKVKFLFSRAKENGFVHDSEMVFLIQRMGIEIREMPVVYSYRRVSTVHLFSDSFKVLLGLFRIRVRSFMGGYGASR